MRISMIGTGYVGLVSGACFSEFGIEVICVDKDAKKIKTLAAGGIPIYEPGLDRLVASNVQAGRLSFTTDLAGAVARSEACEAGAPGGGGHPQIVSLAATGIHVHCGAAARWSP